MMDNLYKNQREEVSRQLKSKMIREYSNEELKIGHPPRSQRSGERSG